MPSADHHAQARTGVLLVNLGTPQAPTASAVRSYLREFLSDPRVVEIPRAIWLPILYGLVLTLRPRRAAHAYRKIWTDQGSPLLVYTLRQRQALDAALKRRGLQATVEAAMCYGRPSIASAVEKLHALETTRLVVLPAYPQYSSTTTAATFDLIARAFKKRRRLPEIRFISGYHDNDAYVGACAARIQAWRERHGASEKLLFSFHGLPKRNVLLGDPYQRQCRETAGLIARKLGIGWGQWLISFQSRFGRAEWLKPYTDETLRTLARQGVKSVDVFCPGFAADCLETLEEIDIQNRAFFLDAGGERFHYIPALNDDRDHVECLSAIVQDALGSSLGSSLGSNSGSNSGNGPPA